jgi:uncharacterized protein YaaN involved in tellurite resistance
LPRIELAAELVSVACVVNPGELSQHKGIFGMNRIFTVVVVAGLGLGVIGCEEKKADNAAKPAAPGAMDKMKDAGNAAADKMKDAGHAVADKTKEMGSALKGDVQNLVDTLKTKVDTLTKGGDSLPADQKPEFDKAMTTIKSGWSDLSAKFQSASSATGDAMAKGLADAKDAGMKLMDSIKTTADKFGIKMN